MPEIKINLEKAKRNSENLCNLEGKRKKKKNSNINIDEDYVEDLLDVDLSCYNTNEFKE